MSIANVLTVLTVVWIAIAAITLPFALFIAWDAWKDAQARTLAGVTDGRAVLARLLVVMSLLISFAFVVFLGSGVYAVSPLGQEASWRRVVISAALVLAEVALAIMVIYQYQVRRRVLKAEMASDAIRALAAAELIRLELVKNTAAMNKNTDAALQVAHELVNGPLAASLASTVAIDKLSAAMDANTTSREGEKGE